MTAYPDLGSGGGTYEYGKQADMVTESAAYRFFRPHEVSTWPHKAQQLIPQAQKGHALDVDFSDQGTLIETVQEDAISFSAEIRAGNAAGVQAPWLDWLEAGGWSVVEASNGGAATTIAVYTDEGDFTLTDDVIGADAEGFVILVLLDSGAYYPAFVYDYTSATKRCQLAMKLPSAASNGNAVAIYRTATPRTGDITATDLLSFRKISRGVYNAKEIGQTSIGCALSTLGTLTIEPAGFLRPTFTFSVTDHVIDDEDLVVETLRGATGLNPIQGCEFGFANASAATINNTQYKIHNVAIDNPYKGTHQPAEGDTTNVLNSNQAFHCGKAGGDDGRVMVVINATFAKSHVDDYVAGTMKYLHAVRRTNSLAVPAWSCHLPRLEPVDYEVIDQDGDWIKMDVTLKGTSANYATPHGDNTEAGDRDMFLGTSDFA